MPGGMTFVKTAEEKGHIQTIKDPIAYHTPVVITPKDNLANIQSIYDLANKDVHKKDILFFNKEGELT
nr:substrate-binding domain-containing protein [Bacillus sp. FJAT-42315]